MHHVRAAVRIVDLIACRLDPHELEAVRRALHAHRTRCLLRFGHGVRAELSRQGRTHATAAGLARTAVSRRAAELGWRDELALAASDALDRHDERVRDAARGPQEAFDAVVLAEALARDVLHGVECLLGLKHVTSSVPAVAVRVAFDERGIETPGGAEFVALLDRLGDSSGRSALDHRAVAVVGDGMGLSPELVRALVGAAARADGFDPDDEAVRDSVERARAGAASRASSDAETTSDR